jgi:hypothetical protein
VKILRCTNFFVFPIFKPNTHREFLCGAYLKVQSSSTNLRSHIFVNLRKTVNHTTYHIKIKKEYAAAIIEDLKQVDAIEIMEEPIPEWQKKESLGRLEKTKQDPSSVITKENFFDALDEGDEKI